MRKQKLSDINRPLVRASEWLERFDKLPDQVMVDDESTAAAMAIMTGPARNIHSNQRTKLDKPIRASEWFKNNNRMPNASDNLPMDMVRQVIRKVDEETLKENVTVDTPKKVQLQVMPSEDSSALIEKQSKLESAKEKKESDEIEALTDSILNLTLSIKEQTALQKKKKEEEPKKDKEESEEEKPKSKSTSKSKEKKEIPTRSYSELGQKILEEKTQSFKGLFTVRNALLTAGANHAMAGSGTVLDQFLELREEKIAERQKKRSKELGSPLDLKKQKSSPMKSLFGFLTGDYSTNINNYSSGTIVPQTNSSVGKETNNINSILSNITNNKESKKVLNSIKVLGESSTIEPTIIGSDIKPNTSIPGNTSSSTVTNIVRDIKDKLPENIKEILNSPDSRDKKELVSGMRTGIRDELVKLSEEQLKELKKVVKGIEESKETKEDKLEKEGPSIIESLKKDPEKKEEKKGIMQSIMDKFGAGKKIAGALGKLGGVGARVAGAAAPYALPALAVAGAGAAGYGVGSIINDKLINPAMSAVTGNKDETLGTAVYGAVDKVKGWFGNSDEDKMKKMMSTRPTSIGKVVDMTNKPEVKQPQNVQRVQQIDRLQSTIHESKKLEDKKKTLVDQNKNNIVDARSTINNNSTVVQRSRPMVRNNEHTFNNLLNKNFSH